jgi:hypothetical protein
MPKDSSKIEGNRTGAPRSPKRTWAENDGRSPTIAFCRVISKSKLKSWPQTCTHSASTKPDSAPSRFTGLIGSGRLSNEGHGFSRAANRLGA